MPWLKVQWRNNEAANDAGEFLDGIGDIVGMASTALMKHCSWRAETVGIPCKRIANMTWWMALPRRNGSKAIKHTDDSRKQSTK